MAWLPNLKRVIKNNFCIIITRKPTCLFFKNPCCYTSNRPLIYILTFSNKIIILFKQNYPTFLNAITIQLDSITKRCTVPNVFERYRGCRDVGRPSIVSRRRHSLVQHGMSITEQVIKSRSSLFPTKLDIAPVLIDNEKDVRFKSVLSYDSFILTNPCMLMMTMEAPFWNYWNVSKDKASFFFFWLWTRNTTPLFCQMSGLLLVCCGR